MNLLKVFCCTLLCIFNTSLIAKSQNDSLIIVDGLYINISIKGSGPKMLVGHPYSGKIGYELTLKPLEKYFTMIYYDPRGTGQSAAPKTNEDYSNPKMVEEIEALRKLLGKEPIWIFAHSDQSAIALCYALSYPECVAGMILSGTSKIGTISEQQLKRKHHEDQRAKESNWFANNLKDWDYMIQHQTSISADGRDISRAPIKWWTYNEGSAQKVIAIVDKIDQAGRRKPINGEVYKPLSSERQVYLAQQQRFSKINCPILILNGQYDTNNHPDDAMALHQLLPNSQLKIIEKAGHFPWVENEVASFASIEEWLKKIDFLN